MNLNTELTPFTKSKLKMEPQYKTENYNTPKR